MWCRSSHVLLTAAALGLLFLPRSWGQGALYSHGDPTDYEQYMLELINAARTNPVAEASRLGIDLNQGLAPGTISTESKPPLALQPKLLAAARGHSDWMLATGIFDHTGKDGTEPSDRASLAGFGFPVAENIGFRSTNQSPDYRSITKLIHEALFKSKDHRPNLMSPAYSVVGLGLRPGGFDGLQALMGTQKFSAGGPTDEAGLFILGVCYDDRNRNGSYDPGEGLASVRVDTSLGTHHAVTGPSGGYAIPLVAMETNTATRKLPFPVAGSSWTTMVEPIDAAYRAEQLAAAKSMDVQIRWSGGPLTNTVVQSLLIRRPIRLDYRLEGTDGAYYDRTMITSQNAKQDLMLRDGVATTSPLYAVKLLPAKRTIRAGRTARLVVRVANNSTQNRTVEISFSSSDATVLSPPASITITAKGKKGEKRRPRWTRATVLVRTDPNARGRAQLVAAVGDSLKSGACAVTVKPPPGL
jgi:hypothetical protein